MAKKAAFLWWTTLFLAGLFLASCSSSQPVQQSSPTPPSPTPTQLQPEILSTAQPTLLPPTAASAPPEIRNIQYRITAALDYPNHILQVEETILIPQPSNLPLNELVLVIPPNAWWDVFHLQDLQWGDSSPVEGYTLDGVRLTIPLTEPWQPGEIQELRVLFRLDLPVQNAREGFGPSPFGYTAIQTNLVDWYPMVPYFREGEGWIVHDPWLFGEFLVYPLADFNLTLDVGDPALVVAASAPAVREGDLYRYQLPDARNFVFSLSRDYVILEGEISGIKVYGYVFPLYQVPGRAAFDATLESLGLYSELFDPYQQPSLTMVQADFNHGMEYEGLFFQSKGFFDTYDGTYQNYLITIAVHETAHQWWYGSLANDQALEPWLDEGLCTFSELLYYERLHPQSADWWWATRVDYYQPEGVIDRSIYDFREYIDQYLTYRNATYLRGAIFLDQLREVMGEQRFLDFLGEYASRYQNQVVTGRDFFTLLGGYVDLANLDWLGEFFRPEIE